jgi:Flp pilus assembly protein TadG
MVEFALIAPVLILMLAGMLEFGLVFHEYLVVTAAAREGARSAAVGAADAAVVSVVKAAATSIDNSNLAVVITPATRLRGNPVTVTVTNKVPIIVPMISVFFPTNPYNVIGTAVMRVE